MVKTASYHLKTPATARKTGLKYTIVLGWIWVLQVKLYRCSVKWQDDTCSAWVEAAFVNIGLVECDRYCGVFEDVRLFVQLENRQMKM